MATVAKHATVGVAQEMKRPYVLVLVLLAVVTLVEVQIPAIGTAIGFSPIQQALLLMASSVVKAAMVALYYMHLRYERRILGLLPVGPLVFVALLLIVVSMH